MRARPIIFGGAMVRALLRGEKTETRRPVKGDPSRPCPYGEPGDRLWVRETWANIADQRSLCGWIGNYKSAIVYRADEWECYGDEDDLGRVRKEDVKWRSPIFMPRKLSRVELEITAVRIELLHTLTEADAEAEGMRVLDQDRGEPLIHWFRRYWAFLHGPDAWDANPLVRVVQFRRTA